MLLLLHVGVILFNLFGWISAKTRVVHRWVVYLTIFSWLGLGYFKGFGYCFLTDWHWDIKRSLGETDLPNSFIKYAADRLLGADIDAGMVDFITGIVFGIVVLITIYLQVRKK